MCIEVVVSLFCNFSYRTLRFECLSDVSVYKIIVLQLAVWPFCNFSVDSFWWGTKIVECITPSAESGILFPKEHTTCLRIGSTLLLVQPRMTECIEMLGSGENFRVAQANP